MKYADPTGHAADSGGGGGDENWQENYEVYLQWQQFCEDFGYTGTFEDFQASLQGSSGDGAISAVAGGNIGSGQGQVSAVAEAQAGSGSEGSGLKTGANIALSSGAGLLAQGTKKNVTPQLHNNPRMPNFYRDPKIATGVAKAAKVGGFALIGGFAVVDTVDLIQKHNAGTLSRRKDGTSNDDVLRDGLIITGMGIGVTVLVAVTAPVWFAVGAGALIAAGVSGALKCSNYGEWTGDRFWDGVDDLWDF